VTALAILLGGCGGQGTSASPPANFKVTEADASVIVTWDAEPGVDYWIFYGPGSNITTANWATSGGRAIVNAINPTTITGLANGTTYSFTINGRKSGGPGGPGAPTQVAVPRLSGNLWTPGAPIGTNDLNGVAFGNVPTGFGLIAVGSGGTLQSNTNQAGWVAQVNPAAPRDLNAACFGNQGFIAAGAGGAIIYSLDLVTWTSQPSNTGATLYGCASPGAAGYLVVGAGGTLLSSSDGANWTLPATGITEDLYAVAVGGGKYTAVGARGTIISTLDGTNFVRASSGTTRDLRGIAFAALGNAATGTVTNIFVAVGAAGTLLTSEDGLAWTVQPPPTTNDLTAIVYGGQFVAIGKGGVVLTSTDGISWQVRNSATTSDLAAVARTQAGYVAVGSRGSNISSF
jgi:hypothetical protein